MYVSSINGVEANNFVSGVTKIKQVRSVNTRQQKERLPRSYPGKVTDYHPHTLHVCELVDWVVGELTRKMIFVEGLCHNAHTATRIKWWNVYIIYNDIYNIKVTYKFGIYPTRTYVWYRNRGLYFWAVSCEVSVFLAPETNNLRCAELNNLSACVLFDYRYSQLDYILLACLLLFSYCLWFLKAFSFQIEIRCALLRHKTSAFCLFVIIAWFYIFSIFSIHFFRQHLKDYSVGFRKAA